MSINNRRKSHHFIMDDYTSSDFNISSSSSNTDDDTFNSFFPQTTIYDRLDDFISGTLFLFDGTQIAPNDSETKPLFSPIFPPATQTPELISSPPIVQPSQEFIYMNTNSCNKLTPPQFDYMNTNSCNQLTPPKFNFMNINSCNKLTPPQFFNPLENMAKFLPKAPTSQIRSRIVKKSTSKKHVKQQIIDPLQGEDPRIPHFGVGLNKRVTIPVIKDQEDREFLKICKDRSIRINPHRLGFIPAEFWTDQEYTFGEIVYDHFQKRNHSKCRFSHKLYNALKLTEARPELFDYIGVEWKTDEIFHVLPRTFARLLDLKSALPSLFHLQGNFPSFGFVELTFNEIGEYFGKEFQSNYNMDEHRYLYHGNHNFSKTCTQEDVECRLEWVRSTVRNGKTS